MRGAGDTLTAAVPRAVAPPHAEASAVGTDDAGADVRPAHLRVHCAKRALYIRFMLSKYLAGKPVQFMFIHHGLCGKIAQEKWNIVREENGVWSVSRLDHLTWGGEDDCAVYRNGGFSLMQPVPEQHQVAVQLRKRTAECFFAAVLVDPDQLWEVSLITERPEIFLTSRRHAHDRLSKERPVGTWSRR